MEPRTTKIKLPGAGANCRQPTPSGNCERAGVGMLGVLRRFNSDTSGAVTADFIVLTAVIVSMGVMAAGAISAGVESSVAKTENCLFNTAANLMLKDTLSTQQKLLRTEQRCGQSLVREEATTDVKIVKLVR